MFTKILRKIWKTAIVKSKKCKTFTFVENFIRTLHARDRANR